MTYSNLISVVQAWIAQSRVPFVAGLAVHAAMIAVLALLFYRRLMVVPLLRLLR
jgi:lipopolysaccharide export system permease protein